MQYKSKISDERREQILSYLAKVEKKLPQLEKNLKENMRLAERMERSRDLNQEIFIKIRTIDIESNDSLINILKNILSISLTGWIATMAIPSAIRVGYLTVICAVMFVLSFLLSIFYIYLRQRNVNELKKSHLPLIESNISRIKTYTETHSFQQQSLEKEIDEISKNNEAYINEIKNETPS